MLFAVGSRVESATRRLVEVEDLKALSRGVQGLSVRIARALNRMMERVSNVFADRFQHRVLGTPRQIRAP